VEQWLGVRLMLSYERLVMLISCCVGMCCGTVARYASYVEL